MHKTSAGALRARWATTPSVELRRHLGRFPPTWDTASHDGVRPLQLKISGRRLRAVGRGNGYSFQSRLNPERVGVAESGSSGQACFGYLLRSSFLISG